MEKITKLVSNPMEIDPFVIGKYDLVAIRLNDVSCAENLEEALKTLEVKGREYSVSHEKTEDGRIDYVFLSRRVA